MARFTFFTHHPVGAASRAGLGCGRFSSLTTAVARAGGGFFMAVVHALMLRRSVASVMPHAGYGRGLFSFCFGTL